MELQILPESLIITKARIVKNGNSISGTIKLPANIVRRLELKDKEEIVVAFLCRASEELPLTNKENNKQQ